MSTVIRAVPARRRTAAILAVGLAAVVLVAKPSPAGAAVVARSLANNLYVWADQPDPSVTEYPAGSAPAVAIGSGYMNSRLSPTQVAVDSQGNVYIAQAAANRVVKVPANGAPQRVKAPGQKFYEPYGVTVDSADNVYVADSYNQRVIKLGPGGAGPATRVGSGLNYPEATAVDASGNVFISDSGHSQVVEVPAGGGPQTVVWTGPREPNEVAVDSSGNLFVATAAMVYKVPLGGGPTTIIDTSGYGINPSIATDSAGDLYVALGVVYLQKPGGIYEFPAGGGPAVLISADYLGNVYGIAVTAATHPIAITPTPRHAFSPRTVATTSAPAVFNVTNTTATQLTVTSAIEQGAGFAVTSDHCSGVALPSGSSCTLGVTFTPTSAGAFVGVVRVKETASSTAQTITVSGTGQ